MRSDNQLFQPSGLNDRFYGHKELSFADYVEQTRQMIVQARMDITSENAEKILSANAPYEWPISGTASQNKANCQPSLVVPAKAGTHPQNCSQSLDESPPSRGRQVVARSLTNKGILLIHGLYDSPFMLRDIGDYFSKQGFLVRSILLPGHGTVPGDLLNLHYSEWINTVDYGVNTLARDVSEIFLVGFSLGGLLAVHKAYMNKLSDDFNIKGIFLISPALALRSQWLTGHLIRLEKWIRWTLPDKGWYKKSDMQKDYAKYESFTCNAAAQIYQLILKTKKLTHSKSLGIPVFLAISAEDEVVCPQAGLNFFKTNPHPHSRFLWYTRNPAENFHGQDARVIIKNSRYLEQKILDFSHICLPISPNNPHYGMQGDYRDFVSYGDTALPEGKEIFLGATSKRNLKNHTIQRLSWNLDFEKMLEEMTRYLQCVE